MKELLIFLLVTIIFTFNATSQCNNTDDYTALRALYLATGGDDWDDNTGWPDAVIFNNNVTPSAATNMDTWCGVNCNDGMVKSVILNDNNLVGPLPSEIGLLTNLEALSLSDNRISGTLDVVNSLENLTYLKLSATPMSGVLSSLSDLPLLDFIELIDTDVTGDIDALDSLTELRFLNLSGTLIVGSISDLSTLTSLINLTLSNTQIVGNLRSLQTLSLKVLKLNNTSIVGNISYVNTMTDLINLDLGYTAVVGELNTINALTNLRTLILANLNLSGCWPESFESICTNLTLFSFEGNQGVISNQGWLEFCTNGAGMCISDCPDNITRVCLSRGGCSLLGGIYQAKDTVSYNNGYYILAGTDVTLNGGVVVSMTDGFEVRAGGVLQIESDGCTSN